MNDAITMAKSLKPGADPKELLTQREAVERVVDRRQFPRRSRIDAGADAELGGFKIVVDRLAEGTARVSKLHRKEGPKD